MFLKDVIDGTVLDTESNNLTHELKHQKGLINHVDSCVMSTLINVDSSFKVYIDYIEK